LDAVWGAIVAILGAALVGMLVPIASGTWVRRTEKERVDLKLEHAVELIASKGETVAEQKRTIEILERQVDKLETAYDLLDTTLTALRVSAQGGGKS
jgi:hypothetical protein